MGGIGAFHAGPEVQREITQTLSLGITPRATVWQDTRHNCRDMTPASFSATACCDFLVLRSCISFKKKAVRSAVRAVDDSASFTAFTACCMQAQKCRVLPALTLHVSRWVSAWL